MADRDGDGRDEFERAMEGVEPIAPDRRSAGRHRAARRPPRRRQRQDEAPRFEVWREAKRVYGRREDLDEPRFEKLRRGAVSTGNRLDLHGMTEEVARAEVFRFVRQSNASGLEVIGLVHGRGLRSPAGPVLKEALPRWLTQLPLARLVRGFASAPPERGGDGVTLVLLESGG